jgi:hypothetical protein
MCSQVKGFASFFAFVFFFLFFEACENRKSKRHLFSNNPEHHTVPFFSRNLPEASRGELGQMEKAQLMSPVATGPRKTGVVSK